MTREVAEKLALNKLNWQVENGYRKNFTKDDIENTAIEIFRLSNLLDGR